MNEMRKLMEMVENSGSEGGPYTAAELYLGAERGTTKSQMAKELSNRTGIDYNIAVLMIDAIDAYEDIRESFVKEANDPHKAAEIDAEAYHSIPPTAVDREYAAFVAGIEVGNEWQYEFGGTGEDDDKRRAYKEWVDGGRKGLYEGLPGHYDEGADAFVSGYHVGHEDCQNRQNDVDLALNAWRTSNIGNR